ncbi:MAG: AAA family ATPase, partial [Sphingomonadales bacterium]
MLVGLNIQDIVLIERLTLDFGAGLTVMTGETGAGKSILLDSLGLALGNRADSGLVRHGCAQGIVTAEFFAPEGHPVHGILNEQGLSGDTQILLRRSVNADGRSRAFINDQPVSAGLLRQVGDVLVEIHGQHDDRGLLDARGHRDLLDLFADHEDLRTACSQTHTAWKAAQRAFDEALAVQEEAQRDEEFLRHAMDELDKLNPQEGEEAELAERRALMQQGESLAEGLDETLEQLTRDSAPDTLLRGAIRRLEKLNAPTGGVLDDLLATLDRAAIEAEEAVLKLQRVHDSLDFDQGELEAVEARLFDIRALSRKHGCPPDSLSEFRQELGAKLEAIDGGADKIAGLQKQCVAARENFENSVVALSQSRAKAADALAEVVNEELPPLKLEKAKFQAVLEPLEKGQW